LPDRVFVNVEGVLHDDRGSVDVLLDRLVRQDGATVDVDLVADRDVVSQYGHVLETCPLADGAVPANNGRLDPSVVLDAAILENDTSLQAYTVADNDIWSNGHVRTDTAVLANFR
jgi:hypothetical protein